MRRKTLAEEYEQARRHEANGDAPAGGPEPPPSSGSQSPSFDGPPRPITVDLLPVPPLDPSMIPAPFRGWLMDIARRGSFPPEYPAAAALVALAALVGKKVGIRPKRHDDWLVVPNLWGAAVGPPSIQKSPPTEEALRPLHRLAREAKEAHNAARAEFEAHKLVAKAKSKAAKDALERAAKAAKDPKKPQPPDELRRLAREAVAAEEAEEPPLKRYITNDATVEKLGEILAQNPTGVLLFRDELSGWLRTLEKQGHEADRGFYLEAWNGTGSFVYDRIGRGTLFIPSVCVSVFGTIQPGPLARYVRAATADGNDGLMQRFQILFYPNPPGEWLNIDRYPDTEAKNRAYKVFKDLDGLDAAAIGAETDAERNIPFRRFAGDAQDFFDGWRADLENRLRSDADTPLMQTHLGKYRSLMPSLALLFHLVEVVDGTAQGPVTLRSAQAAAAWCDLLEAHARRVYQAALEGDPEPATRLAERLKKSLPNPFRARDVSQKGWSGLDTPDAVERALGVLEDRGWVKSQEVPAGQRGGRPTTSYWIHPDILAGRAK
jgi:putative DNA primase/helicase